MRQRHHLLAQRRHHLMRDRQAVNRHPSREQHHIKNRIFEQRARQPLVGRRLQERPSLDQKPAAQTQRNRGVNYPQLMQR